VLAKILFSLLHIWLVRVSILKLFGTHSYYRRTSGYSIGIWEIEKAIYTKFRLLLYDMPSSRNLTEGRRVSRLVI
jgi:hypothetical protein